MCGLTELSRTYINTRVHILKHTLHAHATFSHTVPLHEHVLAFFTDCGFSKCTSARSKHRLG